MRPLEGLVLGAEFCEKAGTSLATISLWNKKIKIDGRLYINREMCNKKNKRDTERAIKAFNKCTLLSDYITIAQYARLLGLQNNTLYQRINKYKQKEELIRVKKVHFIKIDEEIQKILDMNVTLYPLTARENIEGVQIIEHKGYRYAAY